MNRSLETSAASWLKPNSTLAPALVSSLLCWLAFPPVGWGQLAWLAPIGWLSLVQREHLPSRHPFRALWIAGLVFWLLTLHWLRKPHPANYVALTILAGYLAVYLPVFVALSRVGVHRLRLPLWLIAPVVWTGLDWVRGNFMTGFLMGSLAHTQVGFVEVIQVASWLGEYGVTCLILLVASCLTQAILQKEQNWKRRYLPPFVVTLVFAAVIFGGSLCLVGGTVKYNRSPPGPRVALIQGNTLADWKFDEDRQLSIMKEYAQLSEEAVAKSRQQEGRNVDLIIWPETAYRYPLHTLTEGYQPPKDKFPESALNAALVDLQEFVRRTGAAVLTGIDRIHWFADDFGQPDHRKFNSSVMINKQAELLGTYDKMHLVILGEYVPFTDWLPFLRNLTPIAGLAMPGEQPQSFTAKGITYCPNICYETAVPHLIRKQVKELAAAGKVPDVLVNLTNDAWFWGSSELDMHLACGIFRAVEMRRPLLIAANGGLSAYVDPFGTVRQISPRQQTATLLVDLPQLSSQPLTSYARWGDWFAGLCVVCCMVLAGSGWRGNVARRSLRSDGAVLSPPK